MRWTKKARDRKERNRQKRFDKYSKTLEYQLTEVLQCHAGERGDNEGAVDTLCRIIFERDKALMILALDRLRSLDSFSFRPLKIHP